MHELSVCQALLDQVDRIAQEQGAITVHVIHLSVGPLSGVVPELLDNAFTLLRDTTIAAKAQLKIETAPVRIHCPSCDHEATVTPNQLACPVCQDWRTTLVTGDELLLRNLELTIPGGKPPTIKEELSHV